MPTYEYACKDCNHEFEAIQKMVDDPLVFCPECGEGSLKKKISAAAFQLKGSGWYETDFKNSGTKKPEAKDGESKKTDSSSKPSKASSDKPAAPVKKSEQSSGTSPAA